jgi:hypothetical protein
MDRGPITEKWKPADTPSCFIIDHQGVIRHKWAGAPGAQAIDRPLEDLILEAEAAAEKSP